MRKSLLLIACCLVVSTKLQVSNPFICPFVTALSPFDATRFSGKWYEVSKINNSLALLGRCFRSVFHLDATFQTLDSVQTVLIFDVTNVGSITMANRNVGDMWLNINNTVILPLKILDTDYDNWAVVYACQEFLLFHLEYAWIFTRKKPKKNPNLTAAHQVFEDKAKFSKSILFPNDHSFCPLFY